eukprot:COSAG05_NODE_1754_length_4142_cov_11.518427_8_plen_76_part_01
MNECGIGHAEATRTADKQQRGRDQDSRALERLGVKSVRSKTKICQALTPFKTSTRDILPPTLIATRETDRHDVCGG